MKLLDSDAELFRQAVTDASGDIEISMQDDRGVVSFACETVAREVIAPRLVEALHSTPLDTNQAAELRELIERLTWAIDQAARIHESHFPSKKEVA